MRLPRGLEYGLAYLGALGWQGSALLWASGHRVHHMHADYQKDLHSPFHGKWHAFMKWMAYTPINFLHAPELARDPIHKGMHRHYETILLATLLALLMIDLRLAAAYLVAVLVSILQENCVNLFCHQRKLGYRNFYTNDDSTNIPWIAYVTWGQAWHNNHHFLAGQFNFGTTLHVWEVDPAMIFYPLLKPFDRQI